MHSVRVVNVLGTKELQSESTFLHFSMKGAFASLWMGLSINSPLYTWIYLYMQMIYFSYFYTTEMYLMKNVLHPPCYTKLQKIYIIDQIYVILLIESALIP